MSEWAAKRFWDRAEAVAEDGQWAIKLDGRVVKTPAKTPLVVPTEGLAQAIATEWDAQEDKVDPSTMPFTRTSNSALDKVRIQFDEVADMLAAYGDSDLLCYRADHPAELVNRQAAFWDPLLDWAAESLSARLEPRAGVMHSPQSAKALDALTAQVKRHSPFELAAFHDLVSMSGSLVLGFAVAQNRIKPEAAWDTSRVDELWQEEQWGVDEDAQEQALFKKTEFLHAARFYALSSHKK